MVTFGYKLHQCGILNELSKFSRIPPRFPFFNIPSVYFKFYNHTRVMVKLQLGFLVLLEKCAYINSVKFFISIEPTPIKAYIHTRVVFESQI